MGESYTPDVLGELGSMTCTAEPVSGHLGQGNLWYPAPMSVSDWFGATEWLPLADGTHQQPTLRATGASCLIKGTRQSTLASAMIRIGPGVGLFIAHPILHSSPVLQVSLFKVPLLLPHSMLSALSLESSTPGHRNGGSDACVFCMCGFSAPTGGCWRLCGPWCWQEGDDEHFNPRLFSNHFLPEPTGG